MWRKASLKIVSKAHTSERATSLADLHRRREETQSQVFTPIFVSRNIWDLLSDSIDNKPKGRRLSVVDSSIGSGQLFHTAPVDKLHISGFDIDKRCIDALTTDAEDADLQYQFDTCSMADLDIKRFDIALTNSPFSIWLQSPNLKPYPSTRFGRYGPSSSAISHQYSLDQSLSAATYTIAILPRSMDSTCTANNRLFAVYELPNNTFHSESATERTAIYFFAPLTSSFTKTPYVRHKVGKTNWPPLPGKLIFTSENRHPKATIKGIDFTRPTITIPFTGDTVTELHHHNRHIVIRYRCGLTQAKVHNALMHSYPKGERPPKSIVYAGQGTLLLDVLLLQPNPEKQLMILANRIEKLGGQPVISKTLEGFYKKLVKRHAIAITPLFRCAMVPNSKNIQLRSLRRQFLHPGTFSGEMLAKDELINATYEDGDYIIKKNNSEALINKDVLLQRFEKCSSDIPGYSWEVKHKGLTHHFPEQAANSRAIIKNAEIDWLAPFQHDSLAETLISPYGFIIGWQQGSGKARYLIAIALLTSGKNMIAVEPSLLPEFLRELRDTLNIDPSLYQVLTKDDMPTKKLSIVTYTTLRARTNNESKTTNRYRPVARKWRRQINTLLCDEGGLLKNINTLQSTAVRALAPQKLFIADGTPLREYCRDLLPLSIAAAGNARSHQPYGVRGEAYIHPSAIHTDHEYHKSEELFAERHVVTQWVTTKWLEELQSGSKREVPKINNIALYRKWLSPNIQRRQRSEPDLKLFDNCPPPRQSVISIEWDQDHFALYLKVAVRFAQWYRQAHADKNVSLIMVLARIAAVQRACNSPHVLSDSNYAPYLPLTSKQLYLIERIHKHVNDGHKVIVYGKSPDVMTRIKQHLNVSAVLYTGHQSIKKRTLELDRDFCNGDTPVLLSTWTGNKGLNIPQCSALLFYERNWSSSTEQQAIARTQRPQQTKSVIIEYLHLAGSLDEYQSQLCSWKLKSTEAGIDFAEQTKDSAEYKHLDEILHAFCEDIYGMNITQTQDALAI